MTISNCAEDLFIAKYDGSFYEMINLMIVYCFSLFHLAFFAALRLHF